MNLIFRVDPIVIWFGSFCPILKAFFAGLSICDRRKRTRRLGAGLSFGLGLETRRSLRGKFRSSQKLAEPLCELPHHVLTLSLALSLSLSRSSYCPMLPARLVLRRIASLKSFCSVKSICSANFSFASVCGRKINARASVN